MNTVTDTSTPITVSTGITVREACALLRNYKKLWLVVDGGCVEFNPVPALAMEAYGDFVVDGISIHYPGKGFDDAEFELVIASSHLRRI